MTQSLSSLAAASMASTSSPVGVLLADTSTAGAGMPADTSCDRSSSCAGFGVAAAMVFSTDSMVCFRAAVPGLSEADADAGEFPALGVTAGAAVAVFDGAGDETAVLPDTTGAGAVQPAISPATINGTASSKRGLPAASRRSDRFRGVPLLITRPFCHAMHYALRHTASADVRAIPVSGAGVISDARVISERPRVLRCGYQREPTHRLLRPGG